MRRMIEIDRQLEMGVKTRGVYALLRTRALAYRFSWSRRIRLVIGLAGGRIPEETRGVLEHLDPYAELLHLTLVRCAVRGGRVRQRFPAVLSSLLDIKRGVDLMPFCAAEVPLARLRMRRIAEACLVDKGELGADVTRLARLALGSVASMPVPDPELERALQAAERLESKEPGRPRPDGKEGLSGWVLDRLGHRKRGNR